MSWFRRILGGSDGRTSGRGRKDDEWIELPRLDVGGERWAGELWSEQPVVAPRSVDVDAFLQQDPMPYIWPHDAGYRDYVDGPQRELNLVATWLYVFLHHPEERVVLDALRHPRLGGTQLNTVTIADLIMLHPGATVRAEAARAVWRLDDHGTRRAVKVLREEFDIPAESRARYSSDAVDRVLAAHPPERTALAAELRQGDDF